MDEISKLLVDGEGTPYFDHKLCKDYLRLLNDNTYEKDLSVILEGRDLDDIIIVDNNETKIKTHAKNVVPIIDYNGEPDDE